MANRSAAGQRRPLDIRQLVREMSVANPLWGAPRIHGELLKLSLDVGQTTVASRLSHSRGLAHTGYSPIL
jgi:hypothetical protein